MSLLRVHSLGVCLERSWMYHYPPQDNHSRVKNFKLVNAVQIASNMNICMPNVHQCLTGRKSADKQPSVETSVLQKDSQHLKSNWIQGQYHEHVSLHAKDKKEDCLHCLLY